MTAWLILIILVAMTVLMVTKKVPTLFALPIMAILIAVVSGIPFFSTTGADGEVVKGIQQLIFQDGPARLASTMVTMFFGAILGKLVEITGIAETTIKKISELAGDRPMVLCGLISAVLALLFTSLTGLGSLILVGNIALPILISGGIPPLVAGCLFLLAMSLGGVFNVVNWSLYINTIGIPIEQVRSFSWVIGGLLAVSIAVFIATQCRNISLHFAAPAEDSAPLNKKKPNLAALLTPLVPIVLIMGFSLDANLSLCVGILWGVLTTLNQNSLQTLTRATLEGISSVSIATFLMMGIGMLVVVVMDPRVTAHINSILSTVLPSSPVTYVLFFTLLAPLSLYRGPLNIWGLGIGLVALVMGTGVLPGLAVMAAFWSAGQLQTLDPTNTQNIWTASAVECDVNDILKKCILYLWPVVLGGLVVAAFLYF